MHVQPILSALRKHKLATFLIAMEIALACAVLCNACSLIANRLSAMGIDSGVDEQSLGLITVEGFDPEQANDLNARMLAGLGAIPGVESVHVVNSVPFGPQAGNNGIFLDPAGKHFGGVVNFYTGSPGTPQAMGLKLIAGSMPTAGDYQPTSRFFIPYHARVLMTRALAEHLWPGQNPLGREVWIGAQFHFRVAGVLSNLAIQQYNEEGIRGDEWTLFVPTLAGGSLAGRYLIRVGDPADLNRIMVEARAAVPKIAPDVVLDHDNSHSEPYFRTRFFKTDRSMAGLLVGVIVALLAVTAFGIVGLASFWVSQRTRQIGIRRALGATRADILRYFQTENFLIVTFGTASGALFAIAINLVLMKFFELPRLPLWYLPIGVVVLWLLGQLAVLVPALRAAAVPPVVATRSV